MSLAFESATFPGKRASTTEAITLDVKIWKENLIGLKNPINKEKYIITMSMSPNPHLRVDLSQNGPIQRGQILIVGFGNVLMPLSKSGFF